jgi:hypothetical protein
MLTLFTTPVIYLAFDRLSKRIVGPYNRSVRLEETDETSS